MLRGFFPLEMCILVLNFVVVLFLLTGILLYLILENQPNPYFLWQIDFSHFISFLFFLYQHPYHHTLPHHQCLKGNNF